MLIKIFIVLLSIIYVLGSSLSRSMACIEIMTAWVNWMSGQTGFLNSRTPKVAKLIAKLYAYMDSHYCIGISRNLSVFGYNPSKENYGIMVPWYSELSLIWVVIRCVYLDSCHFSLWILLRLSHNKWTVCEYALFF